MADIDIDSIFSSGGTNDLIRDLSTDKLLTSDVGARVVVTNVAANGAALRIASESLLTEGKAAYRVSNGDPANPVLVFSADWSKLFAKVNAGGDLKIGYLSPGLYALYDKSGLATAAHYDRERLMTFSQQFGITTGTSPQGFRLKWLVPGTRFVASFGMTGNGNGYVAFIVGEYDTVNSAWRYSTARTYSGTNNVSFVSDPAAVIDGTHFIALYETIDNNNGIFFSGEIITVTPISGTSAPTLAGGGARTLANIDKNSPYSVFSNYDPTPGFSQGAWTDGGTTTGTMYIFADNYGTTSGGTPTRGVRTFTYNVSTGAITYSTYYQLAASDSSGSNWGASPIPGNAPKAVVYERRHSDSDKMKATVFTGSGYGTTVDIVTTGAPTGSNYDSVYKVCCLSATKVAFTYRKVGTHSTDDAARDQVVAKTCSINVSTNALTVDGTESSALLSGRTVYTVNLTADDTTKITASFSYLQNAVVPGVNVTGLSAATYDVGTTFVERGSSYPNTYIRPYGYGGYVCYASGTSPRIYALVSSAQSSPQERIFATYMGEDATTHNLTQQVDGSALGGYARN